MILNLYFRNKKNFILFSLFFAIEILFIMIIITYKDYIELRLDNEINNKVENRTLLVGKDNCNEYNCIEKNLNKEKVSNIYNYIFDFYGSNSEFQSVLFKEGIPELLPDIIDGETLNINSKNSIIIPKYIKLNGNVVETSHYLNNIFSFTINHYNREIQYDAKIIGIYDNTNNVNDKIIIYYSYADFQLFDNNLISPQLMIILEDESEMISYTNYLSNDNYYYNYFDDSKLKELNSYKNLYRLISLYEKIIILITFIIMIVFIFLIINDQKYNIALKKAIGFTNYNISQIFIKELLSYFTYIYLFLILVMCLIITIYNYNLLNRVFVEYILLYISTIIQIFVVYCIIFKKINRIQIIDLLKQSK